MLIGHFKGIQVPNSPSLYSTFRRNITWKRMESLVDDGPEVTKPFITFTETGFPREFIQLFEEKTGRKCVGNYAESGTKILDDWGEHQMKTGDWIVYTSADSVFQVAAHEEIIPLEELYTACDIARELAMKDEWESRKSDC